jgi:O-antigen ligase
MPKHTINKITTYILILSPFFFYLGMLYLTISVILASIILWQKDTHNNIFSTANLSLLSLITFYFLCAISFFWSNDKEAWLFDTQVKLTLLLIPVFYLIGVSNKKLLQTFLKYLFFASITLSILQLSVFFYRFFIEGKIFYATIASYFSLFMHPSYTSMYLDFSLISAYFLTKEKMIPKNVFLIGAVLIVTNIFLAMSKIAFFITTIIIFYIIFVNTTKTIRYISTILIILITLAGAKLSPKFMEMLNSSTNYKGILNNPVQKGSTAERILTWNASWQIFKYSSFKEKIIGTGTGDVKPKLIKFYQQHNYLYPLKKKLNSHNQYLATLNSTGLIGLSLLLLSFILAFFNGLKTKNPLLLWFIIITFFNFAVENMLNRQAGVLFFAFWFSVLNKYYPDEN